MLVSPSILAAPLTRLGETLQQLKKPEIDFIHLDIMDGHFVPALTFGEQVAEAVKRETPIPLDVHLMVEHPEKEVPKYFALEPHNITFHYEAAKAPIRLAETIRKAGIKAGLALKPSTPVDILEDLYPYFDLFLFMTVEPGYYGQPFLQNSWHRLARFAEIRQRCAEQSDHEVILEVDGGVTEKNIARLAEAGVDMVVAGAFIFKAEDPNLQAEILKQAAHSL